MTPTFWNFADVHPWLASIYLASVLFVICAVVETICSTWSKK